MTTAQIYKGAIAFVCIQLIMVVAVIVFPGLVIDMESKKAIDLDKIQLEATDTEAMRDRTPSDPTKDMAPGAPVRCQTRPGGPDGGDEAGDGARREEVDDRPLKKKPAVAGTAGLFLWLPERRLAVALGRNPLRPHEVVELRLGQAEPANLLTRNWL